MRSKTKIGQHYTMVILIVSLMIVSSLYVTALLSVSVAGADNSTRLVYVDPPPPCCPAKPIGATIPYSVKYSTSNMTERLNGWDISLKTDPTVLIPTSLSVTGNILQGGIQEFRNCVNGGQYPNGNPIPQGTPGNKDCSITDGPGIAHSAVTATSPGSPGASGLLFAVNFQVMSARAFIPVNFMTSATTVVLLRSDGVVYEPVLQQNGGTYGIKPGGDPVANFTWSPQTPFAGQTIVFNATSSHDNVTNNPTGIVNYSWNFGDPNAFAEFVTTQPYINHTYLGKGSSPLLGNFTVILTVKNKLGLTSDAKGIININLLPFHDIAVDRIVPAQEDNILTGTNVAITVIVINRGLFFEKGFNLSVWIDNKLFGTYNYTGGVFSGKSVSRGGFNWDTTGYSPGTYEIRADVMPLRAANGTIIERNIMNNIGYDIVRISSPFGRTAVSLSLIQSIGLGVILLAAVGSAWGIISSRIDKRRRQAADALP
jgi:hypothetical protein